MPKHQPTSRVTTFTSDGCRELWLINGEDYCLPVYATPMKMPGFEQRYAWVQSASSTLSPMQHMKILATFAPHKQNSEPEFHYLFWDKLEKLCVKAPGVEPDYYKRWPNDAPQLADKPIDVALDGEVIPTDAANWIKFMASRTSIADYSTLKAFWKEQNRCALEYLINEQKPLHLGFCQIFQMPYRNNWLAILTARFSSLAANLDKVKRELIDPYLIENGFTQELNKTWFAAIDRKKHFIYWSLCILPAKAWYYHSITTEQRRRASMSASKYCERWMGYVKRNYKYILAAFRHYGNEASRPGARIGESQDGRLPVLIPDIRRGRVMPYCPKGYDVEVCIEGEPSEPPLMVPSVEDVPQLPDVPCGTLDVREAGRLGDGPGDEQTVSQS